MVFAPQPIRNHDGHPPFQGDLCSPGASGYALRALKTLKTYTTPRDINRGVGVLPGSRVSYAIGFLLPFLGAILNHCSPMQKSKYLDPVLEGDKRTCFALTEDSRLRPFGG